MKSSSRIFALTLCLASWLVQGAERGVLVNSATGVISYPTNFATANNLAAGGSATNAIGSLNSQTNTTQTFATSTAGTDFSISSAAGVHTFRLPTASVANRGLLSASDWSLFNAKAPTSDPVFAGSLQLPNGAAPTTDLFGELAADNNAWAAGRGALQFFDGTASTFIVGTLATDTPSNGQVPIWNTDGTITWEPPPTSATVGTVINSGTPATGTLPQYQDITGTNIVPSSILVGALTNLNIPGALASHKFTVTNDMHIGRTNLATGAASFTANGPRMALWTNSSSTTVTLLDVSTSNADSQVFSFSVKGNGVATNGFICSTHTIVWRTSEITTPGNGLWVDYDLVQAGSILFAYAFNGLEPETLNDLIVTGSLLLPNGAAPTTDAFGEIAADNNAWAASRGAVQFYDGTANTYLVGPLASDTPSDGQVPTWHTGGTVTWDTPPGAGAGAPGGSDTQLQYNNSGAFGGASMTVGSLTNLAVAGNTTAYSVLATNAMTLGNGAAASMTLSFNVSGTDTSITGGDGLISLDSNTLLAWNSDTELSRDQDNHIQIGRDNAAPSMMAIKGADGLGTDKAGGDIVIMGGRSTGTGTRGTPKVRFNQFSTGSGGSQNPVATDLAMGGTLTNMVTTTGNVGAGEDDLISFTIPAAQLSKDKDSIEFYAFGTFAANANTAQVKLYFDGTAFFDSGSLVFNGLTWEARGIIIRTSATTQKIAGNFGVSGTLLGALTTTTRYYATDNATLSGATIFKATGQDTGGVPADNKVVQEGLILRQFLAQ